MAGADPVPSRLHQAPLLLGLLAGLALAAAGFTTGLWSRLDRHLLDRAAVAAAPVGSSELVVVSIDDAASRTIGAWPWPRDRIAHLIDRLAVAGARTVVIGEPLSGRENATGLDELDRLSAVVAVDPALARHPELPGELVRSRESLDTDATLARSMAGHGRVLLAVPTRGGPRSPAHAQAWAWGTAELRRDGDGMLRQFAVQPGVPEGVPVPALAWLAARAHAAEATSTAAPATAASAHELTGADDFRLRGRTVPLDASLQLEPLLPAGTVGSTFLRLSAAQLIDPDRTPPPLKGQLVWIGRADADAPDAVLNVGGQRLGPAVAHAALVSALLGGDWVHRPAAVQPLPWLLLGGVFAFLVWARARLGRSTAVTLGVGLAVLMLVGQLLAMRQAQVAVAVAMPVVLLMAGLLLLLVERSRLARLPLLRDQVSTVVHDSLFGDPTAHLPDPARLTRVAPAGLATGAGGWPTLDAAAVSPVVGSPATPPVPSSPPVLVLVPTVPTPSAPPPAPPALPLGAAADTAVAVAVADAEPSVEPVVAGVSPPSDRATAPIRRAADAFGAVTTGAFTRLMRNRPLPVPPAGDPATLPMEYPGEPATVEDAASADRPLRLGPYRLLRELGRGAMGRVYLARDTRTDVAVALKTLALAREFDGFALQEARERFLREAESAGRLDHPGIVRVLETGESRGLTYIAMERMTGQDLTAHIQPAELLPVEAVLHIGAQVAEALAHAHRQGVIHRDIKPGNVMVDPACGLAKVTDFGVARLLDAQRTRTGLVLGSPAYMSPEQLLGRGVDGRSDLYSLGVLLFQLLTGSLPMAAESMGELMQAVAQQPAPSVLDLRPDVPEPLADVISILLEKRPELRYRDGDDLAHDLRLIGAQLEAGDAAARQPLGEPEAPGVQEVSPLAGYPAGSGTLSR